MITDTEIYDKVCGLVVESGLMGVVSGSLAEKPSGQGVEDVVVNILANSAGQTQEAFVNVNIYVPDVYDGNAPKWDKERLAELCTLSAGVFEVQHGTGWRLTLDSQRVLAVDGRDEHVINNKLLYRQINE